MADKLWEVKWKGIAFLFVPLFVIRAKFLYFGTLCEVFLHDGVEKLRDVGSCKCPLPIPITKRTLFRFSFFADDALEILILDAFPADGRQGKNLLGDYIGHASFWVTIPESAASAPHPSPRQPGLSSLPPDVR